MTRSFRARMTLAGAVALFLWVPNARWQAGALVPGTEPMEYAEPRNPGNMVPAPQQPWVYP